MPEDARLSDTESETVIRFLQEKWTKPECPFHGKTEWQIDKIVGQVLPYHGGSLVVGGAVFPLVVVTCAQCGYTVFVNAIRVGVVRGDQPNPDASPGPYYNNPAQPTTGSGGDA